MAKVNMKEIEAQAKMNVSERIESAMHKGQSFVNDIALTDAEKEQLATAKYKIEAVGDNYNVSWNA